MSLRRRAVAVKEDPSLSKLLALEAGSIGGDRPLQLVTTLHQAFAADPIVARYHWPEGRTSSRFGPISIAQEHISSRPATSYPE